MTITNLFNNFTWLFFDKVIRIFGGLFVVIFIARYLGPSDFGVLNYAIAYTALFTLFVKLGLDQIVVRELVKKNRLSPYLLGTAFVLKLFGAIIAILSVIVSLYLIEINNLTKLVVLMLAIGFIFQSVDVIDYFYQSKVLSKYVVIARSFSFIMSSLLKIYFINYEYGVVYFAVANVVDVLLAAIFLILVYKKTGNIITKWRFSSRIAKQLLKYCWPLAISLFLITVHMKIDQVMIGNMLNIEQVGIYSVAVQISEFWYFIPSIIVSSITPYFIQLREVDYKLYTYRLLQLYSIMFWLAIFAGIFIFIFGESVISLLFGEEYINSYLALTFNVWAGVFVAQSTAKGIWVIGENLQFYRIKTNILAVFVNVTLNYLLIPVYGISGAAAATLITRFINNWVVPLFFIPPYRENTLLSIMAINPYYVYKYKRLNELK